MYVLALYADLMWLVALLWIPIGAHIALYGVVAVPVLRRGHAIRRRAHAIRRIQGGAR
ncbi:hypothetical protein AB0J47_41790 [Nocardia sp. NPDC049737]|uniref:hypothetical protein n=1 Tax=Nocardia sp. NPDC049737 TaxID=3154358 RepID=UPI00341A96A9